VPAIFSNREVNMLDVRSKGRPALATFRRKMERAKPHLVGLDAVDSGQNIHY
jgi:hypothetical protein